MSNFTDGYKQDIAELEAIQKKLLNNEPLTPYERRECYFGLYGRINSLKEKIDIHETYEAGRKGPYVPKEIPVVYSPRLKDFKTEVHA